MVRAIKKAAGSAAGSLAAADWKKIGIGASLAIVGGLSAWVAESFVPDMTEIGSVPALLIAAGVPILLNGLRKFLTDTRD